MNSSPPVNKTVSDDTRGLNLNAIHSCAKALFRAHTVKHGESEVGHPYTTTLPLSAIRAVVDLYRTLGASEDGWYPTEDNLFCEIDFVEVLSPECLRDGTLTATVHHSPEGPSLHETQVRVPFRALSVSDALWLSIEIGLSDVQFDDIDVILSGTRGSRDHVITFSRRDPETPDNKA